MSVGAWIVLALVSTALLLAFGVAPKPVRVEARPRDPRA